MTQHPHELQRASYQQSQQLAALGFNWPCGYRVRPNGESIPPKKLKIKGDDTDAIPQPEVALALKWFRDVQGLYYQIQNGLAEKAYLYFKAYKDNIQTSTIKALNPCITHEETETAALDFLITYLKGDQWKKN